MKPIKALLVLFLFISFSNQSLAQFKLGVQLSNINVPKDNISSLGLGVLFETNNDNKFALVGSFSYYSSAPDIQSQPVFALESGAKPYVKYIDVDHRTTFLNITSGYKRYISGDFSSNFGIYGIASIGLLAKSVTPTLVGTRDTDYSMPSGLNQPETTSIFTFNLATGIDKSIGFGKFFAEASINLPPGNYIRRNGGNSEIPLTYNINAGIKINVIKPFQE